MADREKKMAWGRRWKNKNLNILSEKSFLDEIKPSFIVFEDLSFGKNKTLLKNSRRKIYCFYIYKSFIFIYKKQCTEQCIIVLCVGF